MAVASLTEPAMDATSVSHALGISSRPDRALMIIGCAKDIENPGPDSFPSFTYNSVNVPVVHEQQEIGTIGGAWGLIRVFALRNDLLPADAGSYTAAVTWSGGNSGGRFGWSVFTLDDMDQSFSHVISNIISEGAIDYPSPGSSPLVTTLSRSTVVGIRFAHSGTVVQSVSTSTSGHERVLAKVAGAASDASGFHAAVREPSDANSAGQSVQFNWSSNTEPTFFYQKILEFPAYQGNKAIMLGTNF